MVYTFSYVKDGVMKNLQVEAIETNFEINYTELSSWGAVNDRTYNSFRTIDGGATGTQYYYQHQTHFGDPYTRFALLPNRINTGLNEFLDWTDTRYQLVMSDQMDFISGDTMLNSSYKKLHCGKGHVFLNFAMKTIYEQGQPVTKFVNSGFAGFNPDSYDSDSGLIARAEATNSYTYDSRYRSPNLYFMRCILNVNTTGTPYDGKKLPIVAILRSRYAVGSDYPSYAEIVFIDERLIGEGTPPNPSGSDPKKNSTPTGWKGKRDVKSSSDTITTIPAGMDYTVNWGDHGIFLYWTSSSMLSNLSNLLWSNKLSQVIKNTMFSPATGIISLHKLPITPRPESVGNPELITICGTVASGVTQKYSSMGGAIQEAPEELVEAYGVKVPRGWQLESLKDIYVEPFFNSFLDFEPYTTVSVRLPFIGTVAIPTSSCMGGYIRTNYLVDCLNGNCVAQIYTQSMRNLEHSEDGAGGWQLIGQYSGNCSLPMSITGNTMGGQVQVGAITGFASNAAGSMIRGLTGDIKNTVGAVGGIAKSGIDMALSTATAPRQTQVIGSLSANTTPMTDLTCRVMITRPWDVVPGEFEIISGERVFSSDELLKQAGLESFSGGTVGQYEGMTKGLILGSIEGATEAEMNAIRAAFAGGVIV